MRPQQFMTAAVSSFAADGTECAEFDIMAFEGLFVRTEISF
jgi:hypothetical protein